MPNVSNISSSGGGLSDLFINIPDGKWILKSTAKKDTWPGFSDNVIPLCIDVSASYSGHSVNNTSGQMSDSRTVNVNGKSVFYIYGHMSFEIARAQSWLDGNGNAKSIFLPVYYNFDLTAVQQGVKSGTISTWLEKE